MKLQYYIFLLLLITLLLIILILIQYFKNDKKELYYYTVIDEINKKDRRYISHICNIYKNNDKDNINPYRLDNNLKEINKDKNISKNIQKKIQLKLKKLCELTKYNNAKNPFDNIINCNGNKDCDSIISNEDKIQLCTMFNNPSPTNKEYCGTKDPHPVVNKMCLSKEQSDILNNLCNGLTSNTSFKNSSNPLFKHYYCKDNQFIDEDCNEQSSLQMLDKLTIRTIPIKDEDKECSKENGGFGIYSTSDNKNAGEVDTRDKYFKWNSIKLNDTPCTVRPNILARESIDRNKYQRNIYGNIEEKCTVGDGRWSIPTENRILTNERTIHIDHHVPLKNAYISDACKWNNSNLASVYANDMTPGHLKAISYTMNTSKLDKSPYEWMPYKYRTNKLGTQEPITEEDCKYASDWIAVKYRYNLSIRQGERNELEKVLNSNICQNNNLLYPSYPVFKEDPIGISKLIAKDNKNILLTPVISQGDYNKRIKLKTKWIDWSRNTIKTDQESKNEAFNDIRNNKQLFGIYNDTYLDKLTLQELEDILLSDF